MIGFSRGLLAAFGDTEAWSHLFADGGAGDPQAFIPPTSGVAGNGKPIFSWDQAAAQLARANAHWNGTLGTPATVTYAFRSSAVAMPSGTSGFQAFTAAQIVAAEEALRLWSETANITFVRVGAGTSGPGAYSNSATILFGNYTTGLDGASAFAFFPGSTSALASAGDVWVNISLSDNSGVLSEGSFGAHTLAHEIGHAIGLSHPGDYDATAAGPAPTYDANAVYWQDSRMFTVMSYFGSSNVGGSLNAFSSGPQMHDIAAAQLLYGANMITRTGDSVYGFNSNTGHAHYTINSAADSPVFCIWDAGGIDTLDLSGYATASEIDLREESFSSAGLGNGGVGIAVGNISIARGAVIENAIGGGGDDIITGNDVANTLTGNAGNDVMTGGLGGDTLNGGLGFDTANFASASTSDSWHRNPDGSWSVSAGSEGTDTLTSVEVAHFTDRDVHLDRAFQTFSGDGTSDILFERNDGLLATWSVSGASLSSSALLSVVGPEWHALGTADFDGDGRDDILWQRTDGLVFSWQMGSASAIASAGAITSLGSEWHYLGAGDFNGDTEDDIVWQRNDGLVVSWQMDGRAIASTGALASLGSEWSLQGVGDFNGDGKDDFLWRNTAGQTYIWDMNGAAIAHVGGTSAQAGTEWSVAGVGDFNGDGYDDILWRRTDGLIVGWEMNGDTVISSGIMASVGPEWHIKQVGDYNGDGKDDILWQNDNGTVFAWLLDTNTILSAGPIATVGTEWGII